MMNLVAAQDKESETEFPVFNLGEEVSLADVQNTVSELLSNYGAVLFRDENRDQEKFRLFSEASGDQFLSYAGGAFERPLIEKDKTMMEVTGPKLRVPVPLHGEMYYQKRMPDRLWFYCQSAPQKGGETLVCDGARFFAALSARAQDALLSNKVRYINTYDMSQWQAIFQTNDVEVLKKCCEDQGLQLSLDSSGVAKTEYVTNPIIVDALGNRRFINNIFPIMAAESVLGNKARVVRWENGDVIPAWMLGEFVTLTENISYAHKWRLGDLFVINNHAVLHGRNVIQGDDRRIIVRLSSLPEAGV